MELRSASPGPLAASHDGLAAFRSGFRGQLIEPRDPGYDAARQIWNGMFDKRPALIARCQNADDVASAVRFARASGMVLAVRGGGHNASGSGSCDGGLLIDLSGMKTVAVDPENRLARAGGGATWADFDAATQAHGLATPGGVVSATGVGGLTLAGGLGWLRGKYGLSLDNLAEIEIVTADGVVRTANEHEHSDLFWAVRGGGGNFGVVATFVFKVHPVGPNVMFLLPVYRAKDAPKVMRAWRDYMKTAPDEIGGALVEFSTLPESPDYPRETWGERVMALAGVWAGPADEGERAVAPFRAFAEPLLDFSGQMSYCAVQSSYDALFPKGALRSYFKSLYFNDLTDALIDEIAPRAAAAPSTRTLCSVWYMGGAIARVPAAATAFGNRDFRWMLSVDAIWENPADDATNLAWARAFWGDMRRKSIGRAYLNFAGYGEEGDELVRASYGAANYDRLAAIKAKYDPANLFRLNQNIKPRA